MLPARAVGRTAGTGRGLALRPELCLSGADGSGARRRTGMEKIPLTAKGFAKLDAELRKLKSVERPAVIAAIAEAREHGDLSENAEYHAARERQSFIEGRIRELDAIIGRSEVIDPSRFSGRGEVRRDGGDPRRGHRRGEDLPDRRRAGGRHRAGAVEPEVAAGAGADRQGAGRQRRGADARGDPLLRDPCR